VTRIDLLLLAVSFVTAPAVAQSAAKRPVAPVAAGSWRYVAPDDLSSSDAALRALTLTDAPPPDVTVEIAQRSERMRFGQLRYGTAASVRVAIALEPGGTGTGPMLWVDSNRDRKITDAERVELGRDGFVTRLRPRLDGDVAEGDEHVVRFRLGTTGTVLGVATHGYMEGEVGFAGRKLRARRYDGDANGLFADAQDKLWLDLDGDGVEDPVGELLPWRALQTLEGKLWVVRGDGAGRDLSLRELTERGNLVLALEDMPKPIAISATFASDDGVCVAVDAADTPVVVPIGTYRMTNLQLTLPAKGGGQAWSYVFDEDAHAAGTLQVGADSTVKVDVLAGLSFSLAPNAPPAKGGAWLVRPRLTIGNLSIVTCYRGASHAAYDTGGTGAMLRLLDKDGKMLEYARSGFA
jgi:hypothetical protein